MMFKTVAVGLVCVGALAATPVRGDLGFAGIDIRGGLNSSSDWDEGTTFGLSIDLGEITNGLSLHPGLIWSEASRTDDFFGFSFDSSIEDLAIGAELRYFLSKDGDGFYFGGGPYAHKVKQAFESAEADTTSIGAIGVAGYRWQGSSAAFFAEARYNVVSDFNGLWVLVGVGFGGGE